MINEIKQELVTEYRIDEIEKRMTAIEDKTSDLIMSLKIEFYNNYQSEYKNDTAD